MSEHFNWFLLAVILLSFFAGFLSAWMALHGRIWVNAFLQGVLYQERLDRVPPDLPPHAED